MVIRMRKVFRRISAALFVACSLLYSAIFLLGNSMPEQFSVVSGYDLKLNKTIQVSTHKAQRMNSTPVANLSPGSSYSASLELFGLFPIKDVTVKVVNATSVVPCECRSE